MSRAPQPDSPLRGQGTLITQVVVSTVVLTAGAMVLMALIVQLVLAAVVQHTVRRELETRAAAVAASLSTGTPSPEAIASVGGRLGTGALVFDARGQLVAGRVPQALHATVRRLSTTTRPRFLDVTESVRVLAVPLRQPSTRARVVVVAEPLQPYERSETYALYVTAALGLFVTAGAGLISTMAVRRSLDPVVAMARRADDWSEHDLTRRFDLGPPTNELTSLAATLDRLLDRVAVALRTEQRLTADIAHELRTPLTGIIGAAELGLLDAELPGGQRRTLGEIATSARRLDETVTTLVEVARTPGSLAGDAATIGEVLDHLGEHQVPAEDHETRRIHLGAPLRLVLRALQPVLDNAVRFSGPAGRPRVGVRVGAHDVGFVVDDDGPGLAEGQDPFTPGAHQVGTAGLGLALSRRIARSAGGDTVTEATGHGARFVVRVPRQ